MKYFFLVIARSDSDVAICSDYKQFIVKSYYLNHKQIASLPDGRSQWHDLNHSLFAIIKQSDSNCVFISLTLMLIIYIEDLLKFKKTSISLMGFKWLNPLWSPPQAPHWACRNGLSCRCEMKFFNMNNNTKEISVCQGIS